MALLAFLSSSPPRSPQPRRSPTTPTSSPSRRSPYTPPVAKDHRVVLKNGIVVLHRRGPRPAARQHLADRARPALARARGQGGPRRAHRLADAAGRHEDPDRRAARREARLPGRPGRHLDRRHLGLGAASTASPTTSTRRSKLFVEMLREPRFQEDRLALAKEQALQEMKKRNDDSADIEAREWAVLLYGDDHFTQPLHHRGLDQVDHPRRPAGLPRPVLLPGEHDRGGVGLVHQGGDDPEARGGLRGLAVPEPGGRLRSRAAISPGRARHLPRREGREPGPGLDRPAHA